MGSSLRIYTLARASVGGRSIGSFDLRMSRAPISVIQIGLRYRSWIAISWRSSSPTASGW